MQIQPNDDWHWYFDEHYQRVMLNLSDDTVFRSRSAMQKLNGDAFKKNSFSVEDAALFYFYRDKTKDLLLSEERKVELVLNVLVAIRFLKPQMPKSWHFLSFNQSIKPVNGVLVTVQVADSKQNGSMLVIETGKDASLCILAQESLELKGHHLFLGDAIKIMHDRMRNYFIEQPNKLRLANAI